MTLSALCPLWRKTLGRIFEKRNDNIDAECLANEVLIGFIQRLFGMALTGDVSEQILPIFHGPGGNGKTTLLGVLLGMLGDDYGMAAPPGLLVIRHGEAHPTERAALHGKRLVVDMESAEDARLNEALVKQLTGGDRITARRMREDHWSFDPTHTLIMGTNHRPAIRETKNAIWRRVKLVPFDVEIPKDEQDPKLPLKLRKEYPGILAWCVRGCLDWQRNGLQVPPEVEAATDEYRKDQDSIGQFILDECKTVSKDDELWDKVKWKATPLYVAYTKWTENSGEKPVPQKAFGIALMERGFERKENHGYWYHGIALRPQAESATERSN